MPALISSPGVYTANESCVYEGSRRLKNSITTLGFAWPAFHNPLPSLVRRPHAETTLPPARVEKGGKKRKKKKRRNFVLDISYTRTPLKPDETELFRVPIHLERLFIVPSRAEFLYSISREESLFRDRHSRKIREKKGVNGEVELESIR